METFDVLIELMAAPAVASYLGIARPSALQIIHTGLAGPIYHDGQREAVESKIIKEIADRPMTDLSQLPPAIIVRVGPPEIDTSEDSRRWVGWHRNAPRKVQRDGISRWWRVRDAKRLAEPPGHLFVVTVSGLVVDVARITDASQEGIYSAFELDDPADDDDEAQMWRNVRLRPIGGGPVIRHRIP